MSLSHVKSDWRDTDNVHLKLILGLGHGYTKSNPQVILGGCQRSSSAISSTTVRWSCPCDQLAIYCNRSPFDTMLSRGFNSSFLTDYILSLNSRSFWKMRFFYFISLVGFTAFLGVHGKWFSPWSDVTYLTFRLGALTKEQADKVCADGEAVISSSSYQHG